jgi:transposase
VPSKSVASEFGVHEHTVGKWRRRFLKDRIEGLLDEARPGRPRTIDDDQIAAVIERTLRSTPSDATHWSIRSMATETGFSHTTIRRIWNAFGLQVSLRRRPPGFELNFGDSCLKSGSMIVST